MGVMKGSISKKFNLKILFIADLRNENFKCETIFHKKDLRLL